jgi:hypothetical protein
MVPVPFQNPDLSIKNPKYFFAGFDLCKNNDYLT